MNGVAYALICPAPADITGHGIINISVTGSAIFSQ
jgi:hypothetical protein